MTVAIPRVAGARYPQLIPTAAVWGIYQTLTRRRRAGSIRRSGTDYILHGRKWWISGACDSRCKVVIFMGKTDPAAPKHKQQSMVLVPMNAPGVEITRPMTVFGEDDAPHGHAEMEFNNVRCDAVISDNPIASTLTALSIL